MDPSLLALSFNQPKLTCPACGDPLGCVRCTDDSCPHCKLPTICLHCKRRRKPIAGVQATQGFFVVSICTQYDSRDVDSYHSVSAETFQDRAISPESFGNLLSELKLIQRTANEYKDKLEQVQQENDNIFGLYRKVNEEKERQAELISELQKHDSLIQQGEAAKIKDANRAIKSISIHFLNSITNRELRGLESVRSFFVYTRWKAFTVQRRTNRELSAITALGHMLLGKLRGFFLSLYKGTTTEREKPFPNNNLFNGDAIVLWAPDCHSCSVQANPPRKYQSLVVFGVVELCSSQKENVDAGVCNDRPDLGIELGLAASITSTFRPILETESFTSVELAAFETAVPTLPPSTLLDRVNRQRVVIRLLNRRLNFFEKFRRRRKTEFSA